MAEDAQRQVAASLTPLPHSGAVSDAPPGRQHVLRYEGLRCLQRG